MWKHLAFAILVYLFCGLQTLGFQSRFLVWNEQQAVVVLSIWTTLIFHGSWVFIWAALVGLTADILGSSELGTTMLITTLASYFIFLIGRLFENSSFTRVCALALSMAAIIHGAQFVLGTAGSLELLSSTNKLFDCFHNVWSSCILALLGYTISKFTMRCFSFLPGGRTENPTRRWTMLAE